MNLVKKIWVRVLNKKISAVFADMGNGRLYREYLLIFWKRRKMRGCNFFRRKLSKFSAILKKNWYFLLFPTIRYWSSNFLLLKSELCYRSQPDLLATLVLAPQQMASIVVFQALFPRNHSENCKISLSRGFKSNFPGEYQTFEFSTGGC